MLAVPASFPLSSMVSLITNVLRTRMESGAALRYFLCLDHFLNEFIAAQVFSNGVHVSGAGKWGICSADCPNGGGGKIHFPQTSTYSIVQVTVK